MKLLRPVPGFRIQFLIPNELVDAVSNSRASSYATRVDVQPSRTTVYRESRRIMEVRRSDRRHFLTAYEDLWVNEPGLVARVEMGEGGKWRPFGRVGKWTEDRWFPLRRIAEGEGAYRNTVHFSRVPSSKKYTVGVEYREPGRVPLRFRSDGGFSKLLDGGPDMKRLDAAIQGATIADRGYPLRGVYVPGYAPLLRWELAGHRVEGVLQAWLHHLGWAGGPVAVVNAQGKGPVPGSHPKAEDGYDRLWNPSGWRFMEAGRTVSQTFLIT